MSVIVETKLWGPVTRLWGSTRFKIVASIGLWGVSTRLSCWGPNCGDLQDCGDLRSTKMRGMPDCGDVSTRLWGLQSTVYQIVGGQIVGFSRLWGIYSLPKCGGMPDCGDVSTSLWGSTEYGLADCEARLWGSSRLWGIYSLPKCGGMPESRL